MLWYLVAQVPMTAGEDWSTPGPNTRVGGSGRDGGGGVRKLVLRHGTEGVLGTVYLDLHRLVLGLLRPKQQTNKQKQARSDLSIESSWRFNRFFFCVGDEEPVCLPARCNYCWPVGKTETNCSRLHVGAMRNVRSKWRRLRKRGLRNNNTTH